MGFALARVSCPIVGVGIMDEGVDALARVSQSFADGAALLDREDWRQDQGFEIELRGRGEGYGRPDAHTFDAIKLAARTEALFLDPVYTGKALAGLIGLAREGRFGADDCVIFLHTGGAPALFAYDEAAFLR